MNPCPRQREYSDKESNMNEMASRRGTTGQGTSLKLQSYSS